MAKVKSFDCQLTKWILLIGIFFLPKTLIAQDTTWKFAEYGYAFAPYSDCGKKNIVTISKWLYLTIKEFANCKFFYVKCFRSEDSSIKEKGIYYINREKSIDYVTARNQNGLIIEIRSVEVRYERVGIWRFYNTAGKLLKTIKYRKLP